MLNPEIVQNISTTSWQKAIMNAVSDPIELLDLLNLDHSLLPGAKLATQLFPLRVPRNFIAKMTPGNPSDPLLRQVLPLGIETKTIPGYSKDPLAESRFNPLPGLLHKYHGRVLLTITSACGINCRYCFRREFPYQDNNVGLPGRERLLEYIQQDSSIQEIILSGGDPLLASDHYLATLVDSLLTIPHVKRIRIHSRLPVVIPERITGEFLNWFGGRDKQAILVLHSNHPNELDEQLAEKVDLLKQHHITVLNQAVLLKGVNDSIETQVRLSEKLFDTGILPYYLHLLDKVAGAAHFDLDEKDALAIYAGMQKKLAGFLVPKLVREVPGEAHKVQIYSLHI